MNTTEDARWTPQKLLLASLCFFGLQVLAVFLLSGNLPSVAAQPVATVQVVQVTSPAVNEHLLDNLAASDPTLLALVNPHGFSGSRWVNYPPPEHRPPDWSELERWLNQSTSALTVTFSEYVRDHVASLPVRAEKPAPQPAAIPVPPQVLATGSMLHVSGELASRLLEPSPRLPSWPNTNTLADTVVQVLVDAAGYTHSAVLSGGGGPKDAVQSAADQFALNWARTNRFQPVPGQPRDRSMNSGTLVFEWLTVPKSP